MDKLWIRDSNGNPLEIRDIWIRDQGQARQISDVWIRNSSGSAELVYPNSTPTSEETEIIIFNQGSDQQLLSLRYDQIYPNGFSSWSVGIESGYRDLGVKFGMNSGVGSSGGTGTLLTWAQAAFSGVINSWNNQVSTNPTTPFNWDWGVSINIENGISIAAILRGGKDVDVVVPLNYIFFNRSGTPNTATQQVINTVQSYYPSATSETITYHQLHDSCLRANNDLAVWLNQQIPSAKKAQWWKTAANPISLVGSGWWNNNNPVSLDADGTPPSGLDYDYQQAAAGLRTILGSELYREENNGTEIRLPNPPTPWSYGMSSYPYGTYQARANAVVFEQCNNSDGIQNNVDVVVYQSYFPVYPIERTLDTIPLNGYTEITAADLTHGFVEGNRYTKHSDAILSAKKANRLNWFANWKRFGNKAAVGTELCLDYAGFPENRFGGLATNTFDYNEIYVKAILDRVTEQESITYSIPSEYIGKRLIPRYWTFWTSAYFFLSRIMSWVWSTDGQTYNGRGAFSESLPNPSCTGSCTPNPNALYRVRSNIEWRFGSINGAPSIDWMEGSQWHGFICRQLDLFGIERCKLVKEQIEVARQDN